MTICFFNDWNHQLALDIPTHHNDVYIIEFASIDEFAIRPFRAMNVSGKKQTGHLFVFLFGKKRHFVPPMEVWDQALILSPLGSHSGVCTNFCTFHRQVGIDDALTDRIPKTACSYPANNPFTSANRLLAESNRTIIRKDHTAQLLHKAIYFLLFQGIPANEVTFV